MTATEKPIEFGLFEWHLRAIARRATALADLGAQHESTAEWGPRAFPLTDAIARFDVPDLLREIRRLRAREAELEVQATSATKLANELSLRIQRALDLSKHRNPVNALQDVLAVLDPGGKPGGYAS